MKKIITFKSVIIAILILCLAGIGYGIYSIWSFLDNSENTQAGIIKTLSVNKNDFLNVAEYLKNMEGNIYINKESDSQITIENNINSKVQKAEIKDNLVKNTIYTILIKKRFEVIVEEGNSVLFQKTSFLDSSAGLVFSKDGNKPNALRIKSEKIEGNWYYYSSY